MPLGARFKTHPWVRKWGHRLRRAGRDLPRLLPVQRIPALQRWSGRPVGYYEAVTEYLANFPRQGSVQELSPGGIYQRVAPLAAAGSLPEQFQPPQPVSWGAEKVFRIENCRFWGFYGGSIISHDDRILSEISPDVWGLQRHALFSQVKLPPLQHVPGLTAVISTPEARTNYSHWMVDLLPRLELLRRAGFGPERVERYLVNPGPSSYCRETLRLAGVPADKVVPVDEHSHFHCQEIVTTTHRLGHWRHCMPDWIPAYLAKTFDVDHTPSAPTRRLYLSRRDCAHRRVRNEDAVTALLVQHGFEVIEPGTLGVAAQAALFASAAFIVSPHSSALTNLAFCHPGTCVLEIFPTDYFDASFWTMATVARCAYAAMASDGGSFIDPTVDYMDGQRRDLTIDLSALERALAPRSAIAPF